MKKPLFILVITMLVTVLLLTGCSSQKAEQTRSLAIDGISFVLPESWEVYKDEVLQQYPRIEQAYFVKKNDAYSQNKAKMRDVITVFSYRSVTVGNTTTLDDINAALKQYAFLFGTGVEITKEETTRISNNPAYHTIFKSNGSTYNVYSIMNGNEDILVILYTDSPENEEDFTKIFDNMAESLSLNKCTY